MERGCPESAPLVGRASAAPYRSAPGSSAGATATEPLVSVVIACYNNAHFLGDALKSVLAQSYPNIEIIVVDDGSTDRPDRVCAAASDRIVLLRQENRGPAAARNTGICAARGSLVAFLDADDTWLPDKIARQVSLLHESGATLVHSEVLEWDDVAGSTSRVDRRRHEFTGDCRAALFFRNGIILSSVLVTKDELDRAGGFDGSIRRASAEDYDLWARLARYGPFAYIADPLVRYRLHPTNASKDTDVMQLADFHVVSKMVEADKAGLLRSIGRRAVSRRMGRLAFDAGRIEYHNGRDRSAHRAFRTALRWNPLGGRNWVYAGATLPFIAPLTRRWLQWRTRS